jgi:hypothetical protein
MVAEPFYASKYTKMSIFFVCFLEKVEIKVIFLLDFFLGLIYNRPEE